MKTKLTIPAPTTLPLRHCAECLYWRDDQVCRVGHYPRMYQPRHYKRRCFDFVPGGER